MIRKQLIFKVDKDFTLPYSYNHDIMKNLYYYMQTADDVLSRRLHNEGFRSDTGHIYKLFNFTVLFENVSFKKDGIHCNTNSVIKIVISGVKQVIDKMIKGVMHIKKCKIKDMQFTLQSIQSDKKVNWRDIMLYKTLSAVVESSKSDEGDRIYQTPYESSYYKSLGENAKRKYKLVYGKEYQGILFFDIDNALTIKEKFIRIKNGSLKGYQYDVWIECDRDMQEIIYYLGLGQNSSTGLGCLSFITGVDGDVS